MSQAILPLFSKLWSSDPEVRIYASAALIAHLEGCQAEYVAPEQLIDDDDENDDEQEKDQEGKNARRAYPGPGNGNGIGNGMGTSSAATHDAGLNGLAGDVSYSLKRFIRALASPRDSSRLGFAVALTELLARLPNVSAHQVLPILLSTSQPGAGAKGAEERDLLFARLFGIHALIASGILLRAESSTARDWRAAMEEVLVLGEKKAWLRESAGWVAWNAATALLAMTMTSDAPHWAEEGLSALVDAAFDPLLAQGETSSRGKGKAAAATNGSARPVPWTQERLALVLLLQNHPAARGFSTLQEAIQNVLPPTFKPARPVLGDKANLPALVRILKGGGGSGAGENDAAGLGQGGNNAFSNGQLHFVWETILEAYFPSKVHQDSSDVLQDGDPQPKKKKAKTAGKGGNAGVEDAKMAFADFYAAAVDDALLGTTSTLPSKYTGLLVFSASLSRVPSAALPRLLSTHLLRTLVNHLSSATRTLHTLARQACAGIPRAAHRCPGAGFDVLMALFAKPYGSERFDSLTKTKTVEAVVGALDESGAVKYAEWLRTYILELDESVREHEDEMKVEGLDEEDSEEALTKTIEARQAWALDQLVLLIRKHHLPRSSSISASTSSASAQPSGWTLSVLHFLGLHGFFVLQKGSKKASTSLDCLRHRPARPFSANVQAAFRSRAMGALTHLITTQPRCKGRAWTGALLAGFEEMQRDEKHVRVLNPSEEAAKERSATRKVLDRVHASTDNARAEPTALLIEVLLLQSYSPDANSADGLEELRDAVEALFFAFPAASKAPDPASDEDEGEEAEPISVLIDLLVELLQRPAVLTKTVAERVFTAFSGEVREQALQLLLDQISPEGTDVMPVDEQDAEEEDDEDQPDGIVSKKAKAPINGTEDASSDAEDEDDDNSDSDSGSDSDSDEEVGDIDLDADPELRDKVAAALASMGVGADEDADSDDDEDAEQLLNDEQMMELDEQLAEIFRSRKAALKDSKAQEQNSLNARLRIVDLLDFYGKQQAGNPLILMTILPLVNAARKASGQEEELASKAVRVLRGIVQKPKEYPQIADPVSALNILSAVHGAARRSPGHEITELAAATSHYLSRIILTPTEDRNATDVCDVYTASLIDYLSRKRSHITWNFVDTFIARFRNASWGLAEPLLEACSEKSTTTDKQKRIHCFTLLHNLLTMHSSLKTDAARKDVLDFMPKVVTVAIEVFRAAADGEGMQLQVARLREVFKFCMQAVRATNTCLAGSPEGSPNVWDIWQIEDLSKSLARLAQSKHVKNVGSTNVQARHLVDLINKGSNRAHMRHVKHGLPKVLPEGGKPSKKQRKRAAEQMS